MIECKFEVISNNHNRLSQKTYSGFCLHPPKRGEQFVMYHGDSRMINTSEVVKLYHNKGVYDIFTKSGSRYKITMGEEIDG